MKKATIYALSTALITLSIVGCGTNVSTTTPGKTTSVTQPTSTTKGGKKTIALVMKTLTNPFFVEMEKGARKAEAESNINLIVKTGAKETSIEQQIAIVDELIKDKVGAIVISPGSSMDLIPVLKKAHDANITIVNIDNKLDTTFLKKEGLTDIPFISVDNVDAAYKSAKYISDKITKPTKVVIIEGIPGADNGEQRKEGAMKAFKENTNIQVVASETADWKIDEAYDVTASIFTKNPDIGAIFCANDMMALGTMQYLAKSNNNNVLVAGFDDLDEAENAIRTGKMQVTINQQADIQGYTGVKYALEMIDGKKEPAETLIDAKVVTLNNIK